MYRRELLARVDPAAINCLPFLRAIVVYEEFTVGLVNGVCPNRSRAVNTVRGDFQLKALLDGKRRV